MQNNFLPKLVHTTRPGFQFLLMKKTSINIFVNRVVSVCFSRFYPQFLSRASESRQAFLTIEDSLGLQFLSLFVFRWIWYLDKMIFLKLLHFFNLLNFLHAYRVKHCREPAKVREITAALFASSAFKNQNWRKRKKFSWDGRIQRTNSRSMTSWFWARCK